jgi:predicted esterase
MKNILLLLLLLIPFKSYLQTHVAKSMKATNGQQIGFYEFTPDDYDEKRDEKYPLIIFLHGIGERGNGTTEMNRVLSNGVPKTINRGHKMKFFWNGRWQSFLVLSPQLNSGYSFWQLFYVDEMIRYAKENLNVDPNRIILTGISLGGGGSWYWSGTSKTNAAQLSALGVGCGTCQGIDYTNIAKANVPTWAFHANNDGSVSVGCTTGAIATIRNAKPENDPYMTIWSDGGHGIWDRMYDSAYSWQNPNIYEWFLGQDRSKPTNKRPFANAGKDLTISTATTTTATLSGAKSTDTDGKIVRYIWTKLSGPTGGNIVTPVSESGQTTISGLSTTGTYVYQLKVVDDRADWTFDTVRINVVNTSVPNIPPITQTIVPAIAETAQLELNGVRTYDPDGKVVAYSWEQISGPSSIRLKSADAPVAEVSNISNGIYKFRFSATDNLGAITIDTVSFDAYNEILPVRFQPLRGKAEGNTHTLTWGIYESFEPNLQIVEISEDGVHFKPIYEVQHQETDKLTRQFVFKNERAPGKAFYRIRAVSSVSGWNELTPVITVISNDIHAGNQWKIHPNPVVSKTNLHISSSSKGIHIVRIYNLSGKLLQTHNIQHQGGVYVKEFDLSNLTPGAYLIEWIEPTGIRHSAKIMKL